MTPEEQKETSRLYYLANKDKIKERVKKYHNENKEKIKEYKKEYREKNKEKTKQYYKEYKKNYEQPEEGKKKEKIRSWKKIGVKHDDFSSLYDYYLNCKNCEECDVELQIGNAVKNKRCLDHDHETGLFRNVLCNSCNLKRGFIDRKLK